MVDPEQSEHLALAASQGDLLLALRSALFTDIVETAGTTPPQLLTGPIPSRPVAARRTVSRPAPVVKEVQSEVVEILRGDLFEKRRFEEEE